MSIIEEQAAEAERLHKETYPDLYDEEGEEKKEEEAEEDTESKEEEAQPTEELEKKVDEKADEVEDWKQKYYVLKGKYDAEVPRLVHELGELKSAVKDLQTKPAPEKKAEETQDDLLGDPSIKYLHDEYPDVFNALVAFNKKTGTPKQGIDPSVEERISRVEQSTVRTVEERFVNDLNKFVPDWESINQDPLTGYSRFSLATAAQNSLNGKRVAAFYNGFKKSFGIETDSDEEKTPPAGKKDMSKYVAPGTSKSGQVSTQQNDGTITREFINKFYKDSAAGRYEGRTDEANKIEAKINKALVEGRIVG
jgi:DNA uptake protein ComE-like DNA-binding protein